MQRNVMQQNITIPLELAKDLWTLISDAKHPHHESKVIDQIKNNLGQYIAQSMNNNALAEQKAEQEKEDKSQEKVEEPNQNEAA